jgi:hypothetical protein
MVSAGGAYGIKRGLSAAGIATGWLPSSLLSHTLEFGSKAVLSLR